MNDPFLQGGNEGSALRNLPQFIQPLSGSQYSSYDSVLVPSRVSAPASDDPHRAFAPRSLGRGVLRCHTLTLRPPPSGLQAFSSFSSWSPKLLFSVDPNVEFVAKNSFSRKPYHYHHQAGFPPMGHCPSIFPLTGWVFPSTPPSRK